jgi:ATP-dependent exoDNAse (exonuclease V) beta subunit
MTDPRSGTLLVDAEDARIATRALTTLWERFDADVAARKRALGRISFDDLERLAVEAVRIDEVRSDLRSRWGMLLVDEFQDTNARQYELLDAIGGDRLFMVGDEWQSIYRFRGADVDVFRARRADPAGGTVIPMRENFRSVAPVLEVVNRVFAGEQLFGDRYEAVNPGTEAQRAVQGPAVELLVTPERALDGEQGPHVSLPAREREAHRVAERVAGLVESGQAVPGEIALLYARGTGVDHYERALRAWGLPVLRDASGGFYDQRDVRDALALLALVRNRSDDHAALAVLAGPTGRLGWNELAAIVEDARARHVPVLQAARDSALPTVVEIVSLIDELDERGDHETLVQLVARITTLPQLEIGAALASDGAVRVANLRRLVELAASAEQVGVREVSGFLEFVAAQRRDARVGQASIADEGVGAVRLMTIHASKGLEFPHVFVVEAASTSTGRPGLVPTPIVDPDNIVHVALPGPDGRCIATASLGALMELERTSEREESLRLWYVAMTRAREYLYISGRWNFEPTAAGKPRAMGGALKWLAGALDLPDDLGGAQERSTTMSGLVLLDTRGPRSQPRDVHGADVEHATIAVPLPVNADSTAHADAQPSQDRHGMHRLLRDAVGSGRSVEWRKLAGTRLHDAVARLLDAARAGTPSGELLDPMHGPWLTDATRERLGPVVESRAFRRLVELGARTEVPYVARRGGLVESRAVPGAVVAASIADVDVGRIDALAFLPDGRWWIVDWKSTLPDDADESLARHGDQLGRYADVARRAGATGVVFTLVALDRPDRVHGWTVDDSARPSASPLP